MRIALAGEGAFGVAHLKALDEVENAEVVMLVGGQSDATRRLAEKRGISQWSTNFEDALNASGIDAVVLATPTPLHASQAVACLESGKHVLVEIPMADSLAGARRIVDAQHRSGLIAMVGHIRRFNAGHAWIHERITAGELTLRQMCTQTYFLRRTNINLAGEPRAWTDSLLWHHACHSVDLFLYQSGGAISDANVFAGPPSATLGIPLDMTIQLISESGCLACTSLSFNHEGVAGSVFRYICDEGTFVVRNDEIADGDGRPIAIPSPRFRSGLHAMDANFVRSIRGEERPRSTVEQCLPAMEVLEWLEQKLISAS
jgi:2-hydroxy-4-carboxymuconate semialdehyde hemiacetal dehydrogenase